MSKHNDYHRENYNQNKNDPILKIVNMNLVELTKDFTTNEMINNLSLLNMPFKEPAYNKKIKHSTLSVRDLIKFMIATGKTEFTIKISKEEKKLIKQYHSVAN